MPNLISQGGVILILIVLLSIAAVALIIERIVYYYSSKESDKNLSDSVIYALSHNETGKIYEKLREKKSPEARVLFTGVGYRNSDIMEIERRMQAQAQKEMVEMEKNVEYLSNIANIATLLGLLGTVTGMIISFLNLKISGVSDPALLAGGISQALITTAAGLSVAIPSLLFYHIFSQIINRTASRMEIYSDDLLAYFVRNK